MRYATAVPIARGGTAEVVKAWDPALDRWVALKFLLQDDPDLRARMAREARAQARVEHPNVCPVFEVGERDGRAFIAMQYVEGLPLDEAAADRTLEEKVALVRTVADAVHAAHAVGLIHRDLKPGNILVEEGEDGALVPFVVDFGIAREHAVPGHTVTGQVLGTPGYLSPEQARGHHVGLDRRSDVYSLGVVLYELLSGERPHGGASGVEALVSLLEHDPRPLSQVLPHVPRDLESVVMRCLEREPERRYPSARALAEELGRFLEGEPVQTRPVGRVERLWKRARRNRFVASLLATAAAAVTLLLGVLVVGWIQYTVRLERERDLAQSAKLLAEAKERETREVSEFLVGLFRVADPAASRGEEITAREILDRGAADLEAELEEHPRTRAAMMHVTGSVYGALGLYEQGAEMLEKALELRRSLLGEGHLEVAETLTALGDLRKDERSYREAAEYLRRALQIRVARLGPEDPDVGRVKAALAICLRAEGDFAQAETLNEQALEVLTAALGEDHPSVLRALGAQASIRQSRGDLDDARRLYSDLLERQTRSLGSEHPDVAATVNNLAYLYRLREEPAQAERLYRRALELATKLHGEGHPNTLTVMTNLAAVLDARGEHQEVVALLRRKVELERASLPPGHWRVGSALVTGLGRALLVQGRFAEAEPVLREGVEIYTGALGGDHSWVATARAALAASLLGLGRDEEALGLVRASLADLEARDELTRDNWFQVQHAAGYLEALGRPDLASRYRALLTEDRKPAGV